MQQLEIKFFFPLTEQNELDLDFKPCLDYAEEQRNKNLYGGYNFNTWSPNGAVLTSNNTGTLTWAVGGTGGPSGYWQVTENFHIHNKTNPSWLHKKITNIFFGWKWKDK